MSNGTEGYPPLIQICEEIRKAKDAGLWGHDPFNC
jgi:hypothetical protein